jgi:hypothetical protein
MPRLFVLFIPVFYWGTREERETKAEVELIQKETITETRTAGFRNRTAFPQTSFCLWHSLLSTLNGNRLFFFFFWSQGFYNRNRSLYFSADSSIFQEQKEFTVRRHPPAGTPALSRRYTLFLSAIFFLCFLNSRVCMFIVCIVRR